MIAHDKKVSLLFLGVLRQCKGHGKLRLRANVLALTPEVTEASASFGNQVPLKEAGMGIVPSICHLRRSTGSTVGNAINLNARKGELLASPVYTFGPLKELCSRLRHCRPANSPAI